MSGDTLRLHTVDDVVVVFAEPEHDFTLGELQPWYDALEAPGVTKSLVLSVGPIRSDPDHRRGTVDLLTRRGIRLVVVSDNRRNHGLIGMFSWLGVAITGYAWAQLEDAARDVASRAELVEPIVRAALALRAESPAAAGLAPDEG